MEENKLIKHDDGQLQKVGNTLAITNKLLKSDNDETTKNTDVIKNVLEQLNQMSPESQSRIRKYMAVKLEQLKNGVIKNGS